MEQSVINQNPPENSHGKQAVSDADAAHRFREIWPALTRMVVAIQTAEAELKADAQNARFATFRLLDELTIALVEMRFVNRGDPTFPLTLLALALADLERGKVSPIVSPKRGRRSLPSLVWLYRAYLSAATSLLVSEAKMPTEAHRDAEIAALESTRLAGTELPLTSGQAERFVVGEIKRRISRDHADQAAKNLSQWKSRFERRDRRIPSDQRRIYQGTTAQIGLELFRPWATALECIDRAVNTFPHWGSVSRESSG